MNAPSLWREIGIGLLLSVAGAVILASLGPILGNGLVVRGLILGLAAVYLVLMLQAFRARVGRMLALLGWCAASALLLVFDPALWVWLGVQVMVIWLIRCLYRYDRLGAALADAIISSFALAAAIATARHSGSLFLSLWCYFLVQANVAFIAPRRPLPGSDERADAGDDDFAQAQRHAEIALRRLATRT
jgi:hypothetical protein